MRTPQIGLGNSTPSIYIASPVVGVCFGRRGLRDSYHNETSTEPGVSLPDWERKVSIREDSDSLNGFSIRL